VTLRLALTHTHTTYQCPMHDDFDKCVLILVMFMFLIPIVIM